MSVKGKLDLSTCIENVESEKTSKVFNNFLNLMIRNSECKTLISKLDFMNEAMSCYSLNKNEVENIVRTYENLNRQPSKMQTMPAHKPSRNPKLSTSTHSGVSGPISRYRIDTSTTSFKPYSKYFSGNGSKTLISARKGLIKTKSKQKSISGSSQYSIQNKSGLVSKHAGVYLNRYIDYLRSARNSKT